MSAHLLKTYSVPQGLTVNMNARDQGLTPSLSFLCDLVHVMDTSKLQLSHLEKKNEDNQGTESHRVVVRVEWHTQ